MLPGAVALVANETIHREFFVDLAHDPVPCHLRNHAGGGDGKGQAITLHQCLLGKSEISRGQTIYERNIWRRLHASKRERHRPVGGAQDIDTVDLFRLNDCHGPNHLCMTGDSLIQLIALFWSEPFGIVQATRFEISGKNHGGSRDRPGQRATPCLIDARHPGKSTGEQGFFEGKIRHVPDYQKRLRGSRSASGLLLFSTPKICVEISFPSAVSIVPMPVNFQDPRIFFS